MKSPLPLFMAAALAAACSPPPPPPDNPTGGAPEPTRKRIAPTIESEVGALDAGKVQAVFDRASESLKDCYVRGVARIPFLAGEIRVAVRVGEEGQTVYTYVKDSTLGHRPTESCMLDVLRKQRWPKPEGGKEGNAETSFTFEPGEDERPPIDWTEARMGDALRRARPALTRCRSDAGAGPMKATLYVETDGKPLGVGVSASDPHGETAAPCVADLLMNLTYASPGSYAAKVTIPID